MRRYQGLAASEGIAIGPAWVYRPVHIAIDKQLVADPVAEWERLETALSMARTQLEALEERARTTLSAGDAAIFSAHQLFVQDEELLNSLSDSMTPIGSRPMTMPVTSPMRPS